MLPVTLSGITKRFQGNGRQLGYPTANITTQTDLADGVYFGHASLDSYIDKPSLIFVGVPLTMGQKEHRIEVHLLDIPDRDYYDHQVIAQILHFHRSNQKFSGLDELTDVIKNDDRVARQWFVKNPLAKLGDVADTRS